ncbi:hypothetical protein BDY19DRAFT_885717 [Irpex rosettiformis]|uniref:Uncharacterized protein n=1 Tax=Irpex rosettiformis TaxID=378272 RepID=A0ACB8UCM1_9APHY|nr:hypothetical protein BDY19DRAFT_885717 [Irpex rosettiformis]
MQDQADSPCRSFADLAIESTPRCSECIQECEEEDCRIQLTEQCTEQCVVVPCNDAHHPNLQPNVTDFMCVDGADCSALDNFLQCCTGMDYHQLFPDQKPLQASSASTQWPAFTDPMFQSYIPTSPSPSSSIQGSLYYTDSTASTPQLAASPITNFQADSSPGPKPSVVGTNTQQSAVQLQPTQCHRCMWSDCGATFTTMSDLVGHVNLQHLRLPPVDATSQQTQTHQSFAQAFTQGQEINNQNSNAQMDPASLACLWADCRVYPTPASIPGPSMGDQTNNIIGILASHLMQDHLGLTTANSPGRMPSSTSSSATPTTIDSSVSSSNSTQSHALPTPTPTPTPISTQSRSNSRTRSSSPSPTHSQSIPTPSPPTPAPEHDCTSPSAHVCRWRGCGETFSSCDALTAHITGTHVGGGKAHYECSWEGCRRNSEGVEGKEGLGGFSSKQKICRHLQSHTGHRPFQCKICQQNFSEAATLAQHMRRHTQEKPYVCDFPGCGKSFAITGALTIHKRTHNGHKPFKCTYCDRAFTESSNLSKHLRTHTGVRPYPCTEPGCSKTFARPDQLARHMIVHKKKGGGRASNTETVTDGIRISVVKTNEVGVKA